MTTKKTTKKPLYPPDDGALMPNRFSKSSGRRQRLKKTVELEVGCQLMWNWSNPEQLWATTVYALFMTTGVWI